MSPVTKVFRRLSSRINETPCEHTGPFDSNASGSKMWLCEMSSYLASFLVDAASVTLPALCEDSPMYDDAMVFSTVTSQKMLFPVLQGIRERPLFMFVSLKLLKFFILLVFRFNKGLVKILAHLSTT